MTTYHFQTTEFAVSDTGIHLLRSGFNYNTILFSDIKSIRIERGKELRNWLVIFLLGAILLMAGLYVSVYTLSAVISDGVSRRGWRICYLFFIPCFGAYFVYKSLQTGTIVRINYGDNNEMFPLKEIKNAQRLNEFKSFIKNKLTARP
jgi:hypothetical protein